MDYDEMTDHIVKFEAGELYYIHTYQGRTLTLYLAARASPIMGVVNHIFYVCSKNKRMYISNAQAIRMGKYITKV